MAEFSMMSLVWLVAGLAIGGAAGWFGSPANKQAKRLRGELDQALKQQEEYRASVNQHFRKTAELVSEMTRSYAAVYDHLSTGAQRFCSDIGADNEIAFQPLPRELVSPGVIEAEPVAAADAVPDSSVESPLASAEALASPLVAEAAAEEPSIAAAESLASAEAMAAAETTDELPESGVSSARSAA